MPCRPGQSPGFTLRAFTLIELMIVVAIIAILAMVAVPAFMKYIRRSKTTEATMNVRKLYDSSVSYFATERSGRSLGAPIIPRQFPMPRGEEDPTIIPLPDMMRCCTQPGGKCPSWQVLIDRFAGDGRPPAVFVALNFSVEDPFYFHYRYIASGTERAAQFTAGAHGDLDCNGTWSTYERTGSVDSLYDVVGGGGLYIYDDIE